MSTPTTTRTSSTSLLVRKSRTGPYRPSSACSVTPRSRPRRPTIDGRSGYAAGPFLLEFRRSDFDFDIGKIDAAAIGWGDGTGSYLAVTASGGIFSLSLPTWEQKTYASPGSYEVSVELKSSDGQTSLAYSSALIIPASVTLTSGGGKSLDAGASFDGGASLASMTVMAMQGLTAGASQQRSSGAMVRTRR